MPKKSPKQEFYGRFDLLYAILCNVVGFFVVDFVIIIMGDFLVRVEGVRFFWYDSPYDSMNKLHAYRHRSNWVKI
jgi:hypothetical protein